VSFAPTIAVTALNATDNPGPGVGVIRALRADPEFRGRVVGLAYDGLEPGIYAEDLVDDVYLIPYPSQGPAAVRSRLEAIHERTPIDVLIPNLDAELPVFADLDGWLRSQGIATFMPTRAQIDLRSKANLARLGQASDIATPATKVVSSPEELYTIADDVPFPLWVKGVYYGARRAADVSEAIAGFHEMAAKWGLPVIVQADVAGDEIDVVAVGDGEGGMIGAVPMRKTFLTDKGKGWAGVTIRDERLTALAERFFAATRWRGPCEIEMVRTPAGYSLLEVNPRFPAWCFLSAGAGMNLPAAVARLALGQSVAAMRDYAVGTMFVRISLDQIAPMSKFEQIATTGELHLREDSSP
jgi:carbamoyl-phosphate synthase large subunit